MIGRGKYLFLHFLWHRRLSCVRNALAFGILRRGERGGIVHIFGIKSFGIKFLGD
jgi:hypothetical protein